MNVSIGRLAGSVALACGAMGAHAATRQYHLVDLGADTTATAVASNGKVLGTQAGGDAVYDPATGAWLPIKRHSSGNDHPTAVNASGTVTGSWTYGRAGSVAETWKGSKPATLLYPKDSSVESYANDIADNGTVVGSECPKSAHYACRVFTSKAGVTTVIGAPSDIDAFGTLINKAGQIAGTARFDATSPDHAFRYDAGTWIDVGTLGGETSRAYGMNAKGTIVGCADTGKPLLQHAFTYSDKLKDLGTLNGGSSCASGIADDGTVVGSTAGTTSGTDVAFIWNPGAMLELSQVSDAGAGWDLGSDPRINGGGTIVGTGTLDGVRHAYMLLPVTQ